MDLITGIIQAESGEMDESDLIEFVQEHRETLMQLQGSWQRTVLAVEEQLAYDNEMEGRSEKY